VKSGNQATRVWALFREYDPDFSGAAIQGHQVLRRLVGQGLSVVVLTAGDRASRVFRGQEILRDGITIRYLPVVPRKEWRFLIRWPFLRKLAVYLNSLVSGLSLDVRSTWLLWREGREHDIVQLNSTNALSFLPVWAARARRMHPIISMTLVGSPDDPSSFHGGIRNTLRILKLEPFRRAEAIIGYSSALTNSCRSVGLDSSAIVRIPCGVDLQSFHPVSKTEQGDLRRKLGLKPDLRYIVFVGSAHFRKGIDVLVRAFIQVAERLADIELLIVGPCDFTDLSHNLPSRQQLVSELKQELAQCGYSLRAHWVGRSHAVSEYLQAADVFCLPTRREGFGIVIAEAMAVGLPVVTARLEGVTTDIIRSEREGLLISGHDPSAFAEALLRLLNDPGRARTMSRRARARAVSDFSLETTAQRYSQLYRRLASAIGN